MAPTSSPPHEDPSSEVSSIRQRQLAPTVGLRRGGRNREGSAMGSYDDSIAVGRVLYAGNFPIVPPDEFWIPARSNPVKLSIVPIGGIHIFIGETVDSDGSTGRDALHQDEADPLQVEGPGNNVAPDLPEAVGDSNAPGQEEAGNPEESILGNLSPNSDDASSIGTEEYNRLTKELAIGEEDDGASSMNTEEFNRKLEELGGGEQAEVESAQPMQVLATVAPLDQPETEDEASNSDPGPSNVRSPLDRARPRNDVLSPEEMVEQARMDLVAKSDILNKPITPEEAADPEALEAKRQEMLATAQKFAKTAAAMLEERTIAANFVDHFQKKDREVDESLEKVRQLEKHWEAKVKFVQEEEARIRREAILPRKITFATPTEQQPLATPKDNMKKAAELLKKKDEEIDINYVRKLVASAMQQQSKADTSRRLASNPEQCISTAQKDAIPSQHRDDESRTGSTERRRKVRDHPNPIPIPSDSAPKDQEKGKGAMYTGRDKYRVPSPPPRASRPPLPPRRRSPAGNPRPHGPGGINIRDAMPAPRDRNRERTLEQLRAGTKTANLSLVGVKNATLSLAKAKDVTRNPGGAGTRSTHLSHEGAGTTEATTTKRKGATEAGASRGSHAENLKAEERLTGPLADLPHHHPVEAEAEAEAEAGDPVPAQNRPAVPLVMLGIASMRNLKHYDGSERPDTWIEDYYNAVTFAGGTPNIACRMLQLYLIGPARVWLSDLEENTIFCWLDLKKAFENHFRAWGAAKLTCLVNANKLTLDEMINIASDHTAADDDAGGDLAATAIPLHQQKKNRDNGVSNSNKRKNPPEDQKGGGSDMVAMTFQRGGPGGGRGADGGRGQQRADEVTAAGSRAPKRYKRARKHRPRGKGGKGKNKDKEEDSSEAMDEDDASPEPKEDVKWSEKACTFDRSDHPAVIPKECYALVVSPRIDGYDFSKCLMDGGASLNIMYLETLEKMNLTKDQLKHSTTEFHGVVPGKKANSLGSIKLPVAFGDVNNYREEMITFEVVPFKSSYHVIFGRPTYHKFHARACYIYNKLKIPGPNGWITVSGDYKKARDCEEGEAAFAESVISGEELQGY
ncbi:hypothetical protein QYE76_013718 [Lolium multiflorum]|uniref:Uncharacterized protein n=1 Tax=Lolium multiflorum TaxID=4521 RepID=A0AAD8X557_LOLMU|nr:hypothetical protein QYE76_013718 [Lolium multiflorum]